MGGVGGWGTFANILSGGTFANKWLNIYIDFYIFLYNTYINIDIKEKYIYTYVIDID